MILGTLLVFLATSADGPNFNQFGYPTAQFRDEADAALSDGIREFAACARNEAARLYKGSDTAPIIAEAAMSKCSEIEPQLIELNANAIAIRTSISSGFEFKMMMKSAQNRRDELWKPIRDKIKSIIVTRVVELRSARR